MFGVDERAGARLMLKTGAEMQEKAHRLKQMFEEQFKCCDCRFTEFCEEEEVHLCEHQGVMIEIWHTITDYLPEKEEGRD